MATLRVPIVLLSLGCCANVVAARQGEPSEAPALRDPDRGLEAGFRQRLALFDPDQDTWPAECWAGLLRTRLDELAARWRDGRLDPGLAGADWIERELRVAPLFHADAPGAPENGAWRVHRGTSEDTASREPLWRALAAWRSRFPDSSRLDYEVLGFEGAPPQIRAHIRVSASGPGRGARLQHNAVWLSTWHLDGNAARLVDLRVEDFEAVALAPDDRGVFVDVTASVFEDSTFFRERIAPGLDHWNRRLSSTLFPGTLGHHGLALADVDGDGREDLYLCRPGGLPNQLLLHTPEDRLVDASAAAGVDLLDYSSSALLVDLDGDRSPDLVVSTGTGLVFFANDGAGRFERKLLFERSLATSLAAADYDRDGDVDLFVCSYLSPYEKNGLPVPYHDAHNGEKNVLLRNDGAWSFADVTDEVGLDEHGERFSLAAAWEDFDNDGDQDLCVANDFGRKNLYRNDASRFLDIAPRAAAEDIAAGMGVAWADVDLDGWMDLYLTNMHSPAGMRLTSQPGFRDSAPEIVAAYRHHALGNSLLLNQAGRDFRDVSRTSGTALGRWGWGAIFLDFDNDGAPDVYAPNGFVSGTRQPDLDSFFWRQVVLHSPDGPGEPGDDYGQGWRAVNRLVRQGYSWNGHERNVAYWNLAHALTGGTRFADVSAATGLDLPDDSRAAARIDWDGDGSEDLIVTNRNGPMLRVMLNRQATGNRWIAFELRSDDPRRTVIGARVVLETSDGRRLIQTLRCGEGYLAQSSSRVHFGLGRASVRRVGVQWPSGESQDFGSPDPGRVYALTRGAASAQPLAHTSNARAVAHVATPGTPALDPSARTVLPTPMPVPRIVAETWDERPAAILGITMEGPQGTGQPLVILLWSVADPGSLRTLERVGAAAEALRSAGIQQILALSTDTGASERARAVAAWKETAWPFARGFIGEESLAVLEIVQATLHDDARALTLPAAFLIDPRGRLVVTYEQQIDPERLRHDLELFALEPEARRAASVPFPGRWIASLPEPLENSVAPRLVAHGLERPASEFELARIEVRESSVASFEYQSGVVRQRQGRLVDAIQHYRRALAADASYAPAAQSLAAALHESGDRSAALAAYKQALKLDPAHAQTRSNLGALYLELGDVPAAEGELRALRTLRSPLADTLEARIREAQSK